MIEVQSADIFEIEAEALVNPVNCDGVMGRGLALQFRNRFPENYAAYRASCMRHELTTGAVLTFSLPETKNPRYIINFPTKHHWKGKSRIEYIDSGLQALTAEVRCLNIRTIAVPKLGCGLGGLAWESVRPRIERAFAPLPEVRVILIDAERATREPI